MITQNAKRAKNALICGGTAFFGLAAVSCWLGSPLAFLEFPLWILGASGFGLALGSMLSTRRIRWSILLGGVIGIITGGVLTLRLMPQI